MCNHDQENQRYFEVSLLLSALCYSFIGRHFPQQFEFVDVWVLCVLAVAGTCEFTSLSHDECPTVLRSWILKRYMAGLTNGMQQFYMHVWGSGAPFPIYSSEHKSSCLYFIKFRYSSDIILKNKALLLNHLNYSGGNQKDIDDLVESDSSWLWKSPFWHATFHKCFLFGVTQKQRCENKEVKMFNLLYILCPVWRVTHGHKYTVGQNSAHDKHAE